MIYFKYLSILIRCQMQYRSSFIMVTLGSFLSTFSGFAAIWFLFQRFGSIAGWSMGEVMLCFSIINIVFSTTEVIARGFDRFSRQIVTGEFDRTLLRPRNTVLQVMGHDFELSRAGRLAQALVVMVISLNLIGFSGSIDKLFVLVFAILGGIMLMAGLFILGATFSFWSIQSIEIVNIFTDGGREMGQYPVSIYQKWFARFFTFVIPLGCINYYPLLYILGKTGASSAPLWIGAISPLAGFIFLGVSLLIWRVGVHHYRSTGS
jgi:ABC-2 type transport system permease protein